MDRPVPLPNTQVFQPTKNAVCGACFMLMSVPFAYSTVNDFQPAWAVPVAVTCFCFWLALMYAAWKEYRASLLVIGGVERIIHQSGRHAFSVPFSMITQIDMVGFTNIGSDHDGPRAAVTIYAGSTAYELSYLFFSAVHGIEKTGVRETLKELFQGCVKES